MTDTETPRTDAQIGEASVAALNASSKSAYEVVLASFARTLERDLRECVELLRPKAPGEIDYDWTARRDALLARYKGRGG